VIPALATAAAIAAVAPTPAVYLRFLRESGQTHGDVRSRIALELLSAKVRAQVTAGAEDVPAVFDAFVRGFRPKRRARTVCRASWGNVSDCGVIEGSR